MAKGEGVMLMLDSPPPQGGGSPSMLNGDVEEDFDDAYPEDLDPMAEEEGPSVAFSTYAETALGTTDSEQIEALRQAILCLRDDGEL